MKLSDYKGEDALELLADVLEPAMEIIGDKQISEAAKKNESRGALVKMVIKNHKKSILEIMAYIGGEDPASYNPDILTLTGDLLELFNDEAFMQLFQSQGQKSSDLLSGPATEATQAKEK
jgi:hypothetical protein